MSHTLWVLVFSVWGAAALAANNPWSEIKTPPTTNEPQVHGFYSRGCLLGAEKLPLSGVGHEVVSPARNRSYGHPVLVAKIQEWGKWTVSQKLGKLIVGDLAQPAGGPLLGNHVSHQTGLDADIRFALLPEKTTIPNNKRNDFDTPLLAQCRLRDGKFSNEFLASNWDPKSGRMLEHIASDAGVERIFMSPSIKKQLCSVFSAHPSWLRKIRPEWGHVNHFHVRMTCPLGNGPCEQQAAVGVDPSDTSGVGCEGREFAQWFEKSADLKTVSSECSPKWVTPEDPTPKWQKAMAHPKFPAGCKDLVRAPQQGAL